MKRSEINALIVDATKAFQRSGWALPPRPRWDVTDFGLGDHTKFGLVLVNLSEEPEYSEKLMYARRGMVTPAHCHRLKKEDIICRAGRVRVRVWSGSPNVSNGSAAVKLNGIPSTFADGSDLYLRAGERVTITPGTYHEFEPASDDAIIGEVSTANDDVNDNVFADIAVGRYTEIVEDVKAIAKLVNE